VEDRTAVGKEGAMGRWGVIGVCIMCGGRPEAIRISTVDLLENSL
jgi:hypothetical protein